MYCGRCPSKSRCICSCPFCSRGFSARVSSGHYWFCGFFHCSLPGLSLILPFSTVHLSFALCPVFCPGSLLLLCLGFPRLRSYLWPVFVVGLVAAFTINPVLPMGWALCLVLGLLISFFREIQSKSIRTISNRIATYSYGIYISHQFCIWLALGVLASHPLWFRLGVLSISLVVLPILLYHGIEKPMIQMGMRLAARLQEKPAPAMAVAA